MGLTTLYRGHNPFTKQHGHPSKYIVFEYTWIIWERFDQKMFGAPSEVFWLGGFQNLFPSVNCLSWMADTETYEPRKKPDSLLSIESWLFNRDPYVMVYEIIPI